MLTKDRIRIMLRIPGLDRLIPLSCKSRGLCPSCGVRRMVERAAHLVDHVLPNEPVRQWVLRFPSRVRYQLAWDHDLRRADPRPDRRAGARVCSGRS